jgi:cytochrome c553
VHGKAISYTCLGCHGIDGYRNAYPNYSVPRLTGQHPEYIIAALQEYKGDQRSHVTMHSQASELSDQDMADIAAYFASETAVKPEPSAAPVPAKVSQLCVSCHGKDGVGVASTYPSLASQQSSYIEQALDEYKSGERKNAVMGTFVPSLNAQDISEIADYYAGQAPGLKTLERQLTALSGK